MARSRKIQRGTLYKEGDWWKLRWYERVFDSSTGKPKSRQSKPFIIGRCNGTASLTKKKAERAQREQMDIVNARSRPQAVSTIGEFVRETFMPAYVVARTKSGQMHYGNITNGHIMPAFHDMKPDELKTNEVQEWINEKALEYSENYVKHMLKSLGTVYNYMAQCGVYEGRNPAQGVKIPEYAREPEKTDPYTSKQCQTLLLQLSERPKNCPLWVAHALGMATSMHGAELAGIRIDRVNLSGMDRRIDGRDVPHGSLYVAEAYSKNGYTKGKKKRRRRVVPIPKLLHEKIRAFFYHPETGEPRDPSEPLFVMPGTWARQKKALPMDTQNITTRVFKPIAAKVGFKVNWHRLRATYATMTKTLGMDDQDRKDAMGHADIRTTEGYTDQTDRMRYFGNIIAEQLIGSEAVQ